MASFGCATEEEDTTLGDGETLGETEQQACITNAYNCSGMRCAQTPFKQDAGMIHGRVWAKYDWGLGASGYRQYVKMALERSSWSGWRMVNGGGESGWYYTYTDTNTKVHGRGCQDGTYDYKSTVRINYLYHYSASCPGCVREGVTSTSSSSMRASCSGGKNPYYYAYTTTDPACYNYWQ